MSKQILRDSHETLRGGRLGQITLLFSPEGWETWPNPKRSVVWAKTDYIFEFVFDRNALVTSISMTFIVE